MRSSGSSLLRRVGLPIAGVLLIAIVGVITLGLHLFKSQPSTGPATAVTSANSNSSPNSTGFTASDCTSASGSVTPTEPLSDNFHAVVGIPSGWTRKPTGASESDLLVIDAPRSYSHQPTSIAVLSLIGYFPNQSPRDIADAYFGRSYHSSVVSIQLVGTVTDCRVQSDPAAFFQYSQGDRGGYLVLLVHANYLYGVRVEGLGGVDPTAIDSAKQVLGSIKWTVTTPPSR
jgi:hypothetical protein